MHTRLSLPFSNIYWIFTINECPTLSPFLHIRSTGRQAGRQAGREGGKGRKGERGRAISGQGERELEGCSLCVKWFGWDEERMGEDGRGIGEGWERDGRGDGRGWERDGREMGEDVRGMGEGWERDGRGWERDGREMGGEGMCDGDDGSIHRLLTPHNTTRHARLARR